MQSHSKEHRLDERTKVSREHASPAPCPPKPKFKTNASTRRGRVGAGSCKPWGVLRFCRWFVSLAKHITHACIPNEWFVSGVGVPLPLPARSAGPEAGFSRS